MREESGQSRPPMHSRHQLAPSQNRRTAQGHLAAASNLGFVNPPAPPLGLTALLVPAISLCLDRLNDALDGLALE